MEAEPSRDTVFRRKKKGGKRDKFAQEQKLESLLVASKQKIKSIEEEFLPPPKLVLTPDQPTIVIEPRQHSDDSDDQHHIHPLAPIQNEVNKANDLTLAHMIGFDAQTLKEKQRLEDLEE